LVNGNTGDQTGKRKLVRVLPCENAFEEFKIFENHLAIKERKNGCNFKN
jgi:hypothetical protein